MKRQDTLKLSPHEAQGGFPWTAAPQVFRTLCITTVQGKNLLNSLPSQRGRLRRGWIISHFQMLCFVLSCFYLSDLFARKDHQPPATFIWGNRLSLFQGEQ